MVSPHCTEYPPPYCEMPPHGNHGIPPMYWTSATVLHNPHRTAHTLHGVDMSLADIIKSAGWKNEATFAKFYHRELNKTKFWQVLISYALFLMFSCNHFALKDDDSACASLLMWLLRSCWCQRRITIKLHLTGKARSIFKFFSVINYVTTESHEILKPCNHEQVAIHIINGQSIQQMYIRNRKATCYQ